MLSYLNVYTFDNFDQPMSTTQNPNLYICLCTTFKFYLDFQSWHDFFSKSVAHLQSAKIIERVRKTCFISHIQTFFLAFKGHQNTFLTFPIIKLRLKLHSFYIGGESNFLLFPSIFHCDMSLFRISSFNLYI